MGNCCNYNQAAPTGAGEPVGTLELRGTDCLGLCCGAHGFHESVCPCGPPCGPRKPKGAAVKAALADPALETILSEIPDIAKNGPQGCCGCGGPHFESLKALLLENGWLDRVNEAAEPHGVTADLHFYIQVTNTGAIPMLHLRFFEKAGGATGAAADYGTTGPSTSA